MANRAKETVGLLFDAYMNNPSLLTNETQHNISRNKDSDDKNAVTRIIADYIAGMTDRFAFSEAERISGAV
jgi:dGTPase